MKIILKLDTLMSPCIEYLYQGGWILVPLAIICVSGCYSFLKLNAMLSNSLKIPDGFEDQLQTKIASGVDFELLHSFLKRLEYKFSSIAQEVIEKIQKGFHLQEIFTQFKEKEFSHYDREIMILKAYVAVAPLLGLLGTILGMVQTFQVLSLENQQMNQLISEGIRQALITTQFGLIIALPGLFTISFLKKKLRQWEVKIYELELHFAVGLRARNGNI